MKMSKQNLMQIITEELKSLLEEEINEAREGDYKPALDHANKERDVAVFALQKAGRDATQAAQLCFAAHKMLTGEQYLSHAKDDAIADLMKLAELKEVPRNDVEVDINISEADLKKLKKGENLILEDVSGVNRFTVKVSSV